MGKKTEEWDKSIDLIFGVHCFFLIWLSTIWWFRAQCKQNNRDDVYRTEEWQDKKTGDKVNLRQ